MDPAEIRQSAEEPRRWTPVEDSVFLFRDSCNVYVVQGPEGTVLINAGTGLAADHLSELGDHGPITVLLTHHFRDHTDGAIRLQAAGATILGNYWDREYYLDPEQHFRERQVWNSYDNRWDRFSPVRPLPVSGWMMDYERRQIAGLEWEVVPAPGTHHLSNRRSLLHGMKGLKKHIGADRVDTVLVSHYHDDHVNGIPLLQRLFGTEVWAAAHISDILERPERYDRPCLWHEPIPVTRHLPCRETFYWEEIPITLYPMSGHTRFSTLICLEVDGTRVVHTGDQIFFQPWEWTPESRLFTNHVYKNGLDLGCYLDTLEHLKRFRPELVLTGHTEPYRPTDEWYECIDRGARAFDEVHRLMMPLGDQDVHFGAESQAAKLKPYHAHLPDGSSLELEGWILNPYPGPKQAVAQLVAPEGWESAPVDVELGPREQKEIRMVLTPPPGTRRRRQPVALDLTVGGEPFGQVTEILVTVGEERF